MQKFDVILSNAPYDNGLHEKFEMKYFGLCKGQICWVSPLSFLLGKRQNKKLTVHLDKYMTDIESINGNEFFDAAIGGTMGIVHVDMRDEYSHYVKYDGKEYKECSEISLTSNDELLTEFKNIIEPLCKKDNLHNHFKLTKLKLPWAGSNKYYEEHPNPNWWCLRISELRGHKGTNDYFTLISNNNKEIEKSKGLYKDLDKKTFFATNIQQEKKYLQFYIPLNTENELNNFINYIKTDFVCCLLYIWKSSMTIASGTLLHIPWFDFSDPVFSKSPKEIDDYLFDKYNISDEIRKHIEELLPDYYGIRKG